MLIRPEAATASGRAHLRTDGWRRLRQPWPVSVFRNLSQRRRVEDLAEAEELAEAHDQRPPLHRIDPVRISIHHDALVEVDPHDPDLRRDQLARPPRLARRQ